MNLDTRDDGTRKHETLREYQTRKRKEWLRWWASIRVADVEPTRHIQESGT